MKATAIIQARMGSTRLPGKILMDLVGKKVLKHVVDRASAAKQVERVIVATTTISADDQVVKFCEEAGIPVFRGSEDDVLDRYYQCAVKFGCSQVIRITADCPLLDPNIVDQVVDLHNSEKADLTSNWIHPTFPDGLDTEVFSFKTLERAWKEATLKSEREHVTPYIKTHPKEFRLSELSSPVDLSSKRWTLDEPRDFEFLEKILSAVYPPNPQFGMNDVLQYLVTHPELERINQNIIRDEGYLKSLAADKKVSA